MWLNVQIHVSNILGKLSRQHVLFHASGVIFTFVVCSEMYHSISKMISLHCQKDGTTLPQSLELKHHVSIKDLTGGHDSSQTDN